MAEKQPNKKYANFIILTTSNTSKIGLLPTLSLWSDNTPQWANSKLQKLTNLTKCTKSIHLLIVLVLKAYTTSVNLLWAVALMLPILSLLENLILLLIGEEATIMRKNHKQVDFVMLMILLCVYLNF